MAVRDVSGVPNKSPNVPKRLGSTKRSDARKRRSKATSRHSRTPPAILLSGLEVPSSNLGAPIEGKRCKRGAFSSPWVLRSGLLTLCQPERSSRSFLLRRDTNASVRLERVEHSSPLVSTCGSRVRGSSSVPISPTRELVPQVRLAEEGQMKLLHKVLAIAD